MLRALGLLLIAGLVGASPGTARAADRCRDLATLKLERTTLQASPEARGFVPPPSIFDVMGRPAPVPTTFCRVRGVINERIRFEVWLPEPGAWNGRLQGLGNGAMTGAVPYPSLAGAVAAGFAAVGSNLGHDSGFLEADWARGNPQSVLDWGYRATHEMTLQAKAIVRAFYGRPARWSYFTGCSGGGRQALMEAQRFPADYDGILAGDPTIDFVRLATAGRLWMAMDMFRPGAAGALPDAKLALVTQAATAECDRRDGVADGVIGDPRACRFDPERLRCAGDERDDCLSAAQVAALRRAYGGAHDSQGRRLFPGFERGSESNFNVAQWIYAEAFLRGIGFEDPAYDPANFDFDRDIARLQRKRVGGETLSHAIDATDPDLSAFRRRGGKLIHYHGWADGGVPPGDSTDYYETVVARNGAAATQGFYRLFMVPGLQHCLGGPGATSFDLLGPLEQWVEHRIAPNQVVAERIEGGKVVRSRPLCPYPTRAVRRGTGDPDKAESFRCEAASGGDVAKPRKSPPRA
jgi:feruloyl esterase